MDKKKNESVTVRMAKSNKKIQRELLNFEKAEKRKAERNKESGDYDMSWINGYVSGAQWVLSHIQGY